jgi:hypothetical protein
MSSSLGVRKVVLVHGGFVDESGWEGVYTILKKGRRNGSCRTARVLLSSKLLVVMRYMCRNRTLWLLSSNRQQLT